MSGNGKKKLYLITKQRYANSQRKIAFFSKQRNGLYFEVGGFFIGSHTSYHKDGNIFRTSPATGKRPVISGNHLPLDKFMGWFQLGTSMVRKSALGANPAVKQKDLKGKTIVHETDLETFPSDTINIIIELLEPGKEALLTTPSVAPPHESETTTIRDIEPWIVLTFLGHDHNLLIKPIEDGFTVSHFNSRFSTNRKDVEYTYEAYG